MELLVFVGALVLLDLLAQRFGVDSRDSLRRADHHWPPASGTGWWAHTIDRSDVKWFEWK
ncbi:MAG TPA: hypothetical protein VHS99_04200 [Chloroflexota bacterium]|nr:hypothetical protein [Chloroflexota bacterium]